MTVTNLAYIPSPAQGVWHLGPVPLRAYALCIIIGILLALVIGDRRWIARGGQPGVIYDIALWAVPFGLLGGRLYHVITDWKTYFGSGGAGPIAALRIWDGGLGIWGAVALGGVGAWIGCRRHGIPLPAFGDAVAPGIVLAQAIGRIGNYFNQELYGRPTTLPWGLEIYERRDASGALDSLNGVSTGQLVAIVHPTFLYELLWNVLVFAVLIWVDRRFKLGHGRLFALYVAGYCVGRFAIELMRSDIATHFAGIRINSFTSAFVFIGAAVYIMVAPRGREDPSSLAGKHREAEGPKESPVDEVAKELATVAATTGVVAAAKAAGHADDEDAEAAGDEPETEVEEAVGEAAPASGTEQPASADELGAAGREDSASGEVESATGTEDPEAADDPAVSVATEQGAKAGPEVAEINQPAEPAAKTDTAADTRDERSEVMAEAEPEGEPDVAEADEPIEAADETAVADGEEPQTAEERVAEDERAGPEHAEDESAEASRKRRWTTPNPNLLKLMRKSKSLSRMPRRPKRMP